MRRLLRVAVVVFIAGASFAAWVLKQTSELQAVVDYEQAHAEDCRRMADRITEAQKQAASRDVDYILRKPPVFISLLNQVARGCSIPSTAMSVDRDAPHAAPQITPRVRDVGARVTLRGVSIKQVVDFFSQVIRAQAYLQLRELTLSQSPPRSGKWEAAGVVSYFLWDDGRPDPHRASGPR